MSKKSYRKSEQQNLNRQSLDIFLRQNTLSRQKQIMKRAFLDYLGVVIMFFMLELIVIVVVLSTEDAAHSNRIIFGVIPFIVCITIVFVCLFLRCYLIFSRINKIKFSANQTIEITCKKVRFLTRPISRYSSVIVCIILVDENGKKYYDVTNEISDHVKKGTKKELLNAKVSLDCYENTNYVRAYQVLDSSELTEKEKKDIPFVLPDDIVTKKNFETENKK